MILDIGAIKVAFPNDLSTTLQTYYKLVKQLGKVILFVLCEDILNSFEILGKAETEMKFDISIILYL